MSYISTGSKNEDDLLTLNMPKKCTILHHSGSLVHQRVAELFKAKQIKLLRWKTGLTLKYKKLTFLDGVSKSP